MKNLVIILLFSVFPFDLGKIARINEAKKQAEEAFSQGKFDIALEKFHFLADTLNVQEDGIILNLAHCYFKLDKKAEAVSYYTKASYSEDKKISSIANQQLGVLAFNEKKNESALHFFKESLKDFPENEQARYNYELVKKILTKEEENKKEWRRK